MSAQQSLTLESLSLHNKSSPSRPSSRARTGTQAAGVAVLGLVGAAAVLVGVRLPWLSTFDHLLSQSGWGTRNGTILAGLAAVAAVLAFAQLISSRPALRWLLVGTGFVSAGFAGYLLAQLYAAMQSLDGMSFAAKGPGLYVALAGGSLVFLTVFVPMPRASTADAAPAPAAEREPELRSRLRYPVAACAVVAALAHVPVTPQHLAEARYLGVLFLGVTVTLVLAATALLVTDHRATYAVIAAVSLLTAAGYVVSRTMGLPLMHDDVGRWLEPLGVLSVVAELGAGALALIAVRSRVTAP